MTDEHTGKTRADLPEHWWQLESSCMILADWFSRHVLGLFLSVRDTFDGKVSDVIATGFILEHADNLLWITAGHVVDRINEIQASSRLELRQMVWMDGCDIQGAEAVIVHDRQLLTFSTSTQDLDFGAVALVGFDKANLLRCGRVLPMTEQSWTNLHLAQPEGYYLIGYPQQWLEVRRRRKSSRMVQASATGNIVCLPMMRIERPKPVPPGSFWRFPEGFYAQILPFADRPNGQPDDIAGMSGGPILSVERDSHAQLRYRLFGIHSAWLPRKRIIRAEPIHKVASIIDTNSLS